MIVTGLPEIRERFSIEHTLKSLNLQSKPSFQQNIKYWQCPFHETRRAQIIEEWDEIGIDEKLHPFSVVQDRTFFCKECRRSGDITILHKFLNQTANAGVSFFELMLGEQFLPQSLAGNQTEKFEEQISEEKKLLEIGTLFIDLPEQEFKPSWQTVNECLKRLKTNGSLANFAFGKGWLRETCEGEFPLGLGQEYLKGHPTLAFPKILLSNKFQNYFGRKGLVGSKLRLQPESEKEAFSALGKKVKWVAPKNYLQSIPWEFDAHDEADILFVVIGPGSGLRLFNELNTDKSLHETLGLRCHVTAMDSYWNLTPAALVRDLTVSNVQSIYDGYTKINILIDTQVTPLQRKMLSTSLKLIKKFAGNSTSVRAVNINAAGVGEFFERGGSITALAELCKYAEEI